MNPKEANALHALDAGAADDAGSAWDAGEDARPIAPATVPDDVVMTPRAQDERQPLEGGGR